MKKRMHKLCTILTASALLAMSVTVYAAEGDNTEAGFQPAEEGTVQSADTEQTEEKDPEENGLDSFIYIREKEDKTTEKAKVKKVTIEELKEEIDADQVPELAAVVFQFSDEEFETEALTENTTEFETETQSETTESESETATETETESETDKDSEIEKYPTVELSDMQKDMVDFQDFARYGSFYFNGTCTCCLRSCFWSCFWCCFRSCLWCCRCCTSCSFFYCYIISCTIYCDCICFHFKSSCQALCHLFDFLIERTTKLSPEVFS